MKKPEDKFRDYQEASDEASRMAQVLYDAENLFDSSMKGVFIDLVVTKYIEKTAADFIKMFETILEKQTEDYDTYGDFDESVTKLKITGEIGRDTRDYDYAATGIYMKDISRGQSYVIIKVVEKHKLHDRFVDTTYHVRKVTKEIKTKSIDFKTYVRYGDSRDDGYTVTFQIPKFDQPLKVKEERGMIYRYERYEMALSALRSIHFDITMNETEEQSNG